MSQPSPELRVVADPDDYDEAVAFYRHVLALPEQPAFDGDGETTVPILDAGRVAFG